MRTRSTTFNVHAARAPTSAKASGYGLVVLMSLALGFCSLPPAAFGQLPRALFTPGPKTSEQQPETEPEETSRQPPTEETPEAESEQPDDPQAATEQPDDPQPATEQPGEEADTPTEQPAPRPRLVTSGAAELAAFLDGILGVQVRSKHIAGATIAVVADGEVLFAKGYGYADVAERKPVDPRQTMFRIGSVSKLFTWTAVMQLVEQGKLDLDADVNTYLQDLQVPSTFSEPITLTHLLTHTPGFEDHVIGLFAHSADKIRPLGELLADEMPARVRQPGQLASYSNHGAALAGYIVAQVSGMPWADYIEQQILEPLEMRYTMVRQPPEDELPDELSLGYKRENGRFEPQGFEYVPAEPAGSVSASAVDMAKFMIAHLQDGRYGSAQILQQDTAQKMRETLFQPHPNVDGMAYGFWELNRNGQRIIHHGGDTFWFHSLWAIIPEENVGFFVSYNTDTGATGRVELLNGFLDHYYPVTDPPRLKPLDGSGDRARRVEGSYAMIRHSHTSFTKLARITGVANVSVADDGTLTVGNLFGGGEAYAEVRPLVFRRADGKETIAFRTDANDRITHMFISSLPAIALERLWWYETPNFQLGLVGGSIALLLSALVGWPFAWFITRGCEVPGGPRTAVSALVSWLGWITAVASAGYLVGFTVVMSDANQVAFGISPFLERLQLAPPVIAGLTLCVLLATVVAWRNGYWRFTGRLHYTLVSLSAAALVWLMLHWKLLELPRWF